MADVFNPKHLPTAIPVARGPKLRSGVPIVAGFMPVAVLLYDENFEVPYFDPRTGRGYQRPPAGSRVNELVADLRKSRVDLPTAVLLNLRNREAKHALDEGSLRLDLVQEGLAQRGKFFVVDGQHRVLALQKLAEEEGLLKWGEFPLPFICMVGATEQEEMEQFYVVNSRAKSVRTDLALSLLRTISDRDPKMLERLNERGSGWQVTAQKLVEALGNDSSVWRGRIRLAAMEKGDTTMPSASMVTSLKPLLTSSFFSRLSFEQQQQVLDAFWRGLRELMRPAFDEPKDYVIQKGIGVMVMHVILVDVLEIIRSGGKSVIEPESHSEVMQEAVEKLSGEAQDGIGSPVSGVDFWRIAPEGAAGSYSSSSGRRLLIAKIRQLLPFVKAL